MPLRGGRTRSLRLGLGEIAVFARAGARIPLAAESAAGGVDAPAADHWLA
jgi:hypothetical protein